MNSQFHPPTTRDQIVSLLPEMRAFAMSLTRNHASADDLVQDAVVKAWKNFHQFQDGGNLRAWVFTILRNTYYSDLRKKRRETDHLIDTEASARQPVGPSDQIIDVMDFEKAFQTLPVEQREALTLVAASGMTYEDAAQTCGVAIGTIKSRINRGRQRLAELLGKDQG